MKPRGEFTNWLEKQYLDWQIEQGGRKSITDFSAHLGFALTTVDQWMNGRRKKISPDNAFRLAQRLGLEVYDVLGLPCPDPLLFRLRVKWDILNERDREAIG